MTVQTHSCRVSTNSVAVYYGFEICQDTHSGTYPCAMKFGCWICFGAVQICWRKRRIQLVHIRALTMMTSAVHLGRTHCTPPHNPSLLVRSCRYIIFGKHMIALLAGCIKDNVLPAGSVSYECWRIIHWQAEHSSLQSLLRTGCVLSNPSIQSQSS